eukprot:15452758-Alexandrium_andersonii.AAC.1
MPWPGMPRTALSWLRGGPLARLFGVQVAYPGRARRLRGRAVGRRLPAAYRGRVRRALRVFGCAAGSRT